MKLIAIFLIGVIVLSGCADYQARQDIEELDERVDVLEDGELTYTIDFHWELFGFQHTDDEGFWVAYYMTIYNGFSEPILFEGGRLQSNYYNFFDEKMVELTAFEQLEFECELGDFPNRVDSGQEIEKKFYCNIYCSHFQKLPPPNLEFLKFKFADSNVEVLNDDFTYGRPELRLDKLRDLWFEVCEQSQGRMKDK